jgi:hypothetical protein
MIWSSKELKECLMRESLLALLTRDLVRPLRTEYNLEPHQLLVDTVIVDAMLTESLMGILPACDVRSNLGMVM